MVQSIFVLLCALMPAVAEPLFEASNGQVGIEYSFQIPISNPQNVQFSFRKVAGELPAGIVLDETGLIHGVPTSAGSATFTVAVLRNNVELSRVECAIEIQQASPINQQAVAVLGFQQAGAAGADSRQSFFFNFFIDRPLPWRNRSPGVASWWGSVRVASAPRQINSPVSVAALTSNAGTLKVNELAQSAEFLTGLDFQLGKFTLPNVRSGLYFTVGGGASGLLNADSTSNYPAFQLDPLAPDYARLIQSYPQAAKYEYISFVPPARSQYDAEYFSGFRLLTQRGDGPPATVAFTVGQNELVTGGELRGAVGRIEAFFPISTLQTGLFSCIYLFGTAEIRLHGPQNLQRYNFPVVAATPPLSETLYVTNPSNRDVYSIGLGLDLVKVLGALNVSVKAGKQ